MSDWDDLRASGFLTEDGLFDLNLVYHTFTSINKELETDAAFEECITSLHRISVLFAKYARTTTLHRNFYSLDFLRMYATICIIYAEASLLAGMPANAHQASVAAAMINPNPSTGFYEKCNEIAETSAKALGTTPTIAIRGIAATGPPSFEECTTQLSWLLSKGILP